MNTFWWFAIFLIIGVAGLIFVIVKTRSALDEVSYLIKDKRIREAIDHYCGWDFILTVYLIILCAFTTWFIFAPH